VILHRRTPIPTTIQPFSISVPVIPIQSRPTVETKERIVT
jgi:hypothetical protein